MSRMQEGDTGSSTSNNYTIHGYTSRLYTGTGHDTTAQPVDFVETLRSNWTNRKVSSLDMIKKTGARVVVLLHEYALPFGASGDVLHVILPTNVTVELNPFVGDLCNCTFEIPWDVNTGTLGVVEFAIMEVKTCKMLSMAKYGVEGDIHGDYQSFSKVKIEVSPACAYMTLKIADYYITNRFFDLFRIEASGGKGWLVR